MEPLKTARSVGTNREKDVRGDFSATNSDDDGELAELLSMSEACHKSSLLCRQ